MPKFYSVVIVFLFTSALQSQTRTVGVTSYSSKNLDGYCLFSPVGTTKSFLIDKCGRKINEWNSNYWPGLSLCLQKDGSIYRAGVNKTLAFGGGTGGIIERFDWDGNLLWQWELADSNNVLHHDFKVMPNGHLLVIIWENHSINDAINQGRNPANTKYSVWSERIEEIEPYGTDSAIVHWQWKAWDHLIQDYDSTKSNYGVVASHRELFDINFVNGNNQNTGQDWFHFNSVDYNAEFDQILLTSHSLDEVYIIDHSANTTQAAGHSGGRQNKGGDVLYRWGNPQSYKAGNTNDRKLFKPHHAHWAKNDGATTSEILIFNNGLDRPVNKYTSLISINPPVNPDGAYSYVSSQKFEPSTENTVYKAKNPTDFYTNIMGGFRNIGSNRYLVTESTKGKIFEIYKDTIVWTYVNPLSGSTSTEQGKTATNNFVFRAEFYPLNFEAFTGKTLTPGVEVETNPYKKKLCDPPPLPQYTVSKIRHQNASSGVADSLNVKCLISGTVQSENLGKKHLEFFLADQTGSIRIQSNKNFAFIPKVGDSILLQGVLKQPNGWTTFTSLDTIIRLDSLKPLLPQRAERPRESNESQQIFIKKVRLKDPANWPSANIPDSAFRQLAVINLDNGIDSIRIYGSTDINGSTAPASYFNVSGFSGQNDPAKPYQEGYFIIPLRTSDIQNSLLSQVGFQKNMDTLFKTNTGIALPLLADNQNEYTFDLAIVSGDAAEGSDFALSAKTASVAENNPIPNIVLNYGNMADFENYRQVTLAIRNVKGPAVIDRDSLFTAYIQGKKVAAQSIQVESVAGIHIFPNPATSSFAIAAPSNISRINVRNCSGALIHNAVCNQREVAIALHSPAGVYFVEVQLTDGSSGIYQLLIAD